MNINDHIEGTEDTALQSYDSCYCQELVDEETCVCCESCIVITEAGNKYAIGQERKEVQDDLENTPEDCKWFEYELVSGEDVSLSREKIEAVKSWGVELV